MKPDLHNSGDFKRKIDEWLRKDPNVNWILDTRKRNECSIFSSMRLFQKYGRHELHGRLLNRESKHIEFIGVNGCGKTTLYHFANRYLKQHLGYFPGPIKTWMEILDDDRVTTGKNYPYKLLDNFILGHKDFFSWAINRYSTFAGGWHKLKDIDFSLSYFLAICSFYQSRKREDYSAWTMLDEGFCDTLLRLTSNSNYEIQADLVDELISLMPKTDLIFHIKADIDNCIERLNQRSQGIPGPFRRLSDSELIELIRIKEGLTSSFIKSIATNNKTVVEIENNGSMEDSIVKVKASLDELI